MSEPFVGEIRLWGTNFAPDGWAYCDGQILSIQQYTALYAVIGNIYGGSPSTNFGLPDLRGRAPVHFGMDMQQIGMRTGEETHIINGSEMPSHSHSLMAATTDATDSLSEGKIFAKTQNSIPDMYTNNGPDRYLHGDVIGNTGGNGDHTNIQPSLGLAFCIALDGVYPSRP